jgi:IS605 OrfB family transposase
MRTAVVRLRLIGLCESSNGNLISAGWKGWSPEGAARAFFVRTRLRQLGWEVFRTLNHILDTFYATFRPFADIAVQKEIQEQGNIPPRRSLAYQIARSQLTSLRYWKDKEDENAETESLPPWSVSSSVYNAVSDAAESAYRVSIRDVQIGKRRFVSFKAPQPIPIRDKASRIFRTRLLELHGENGEQKLRETDGYVFEAKLFADEDPCLFQVVGTSPGSWAIMNRVASGSYAAANVRIFHRKGSKGGWFVDVTYVCERITGTVDVSDGNFYLVRSLPEKVEERKVEESEGESKKCGPVKRKGRLSSDSGESRVRLTGDVDDLSAGMTIRATGSWHRFWVDPSGKKTSVKTFESGARALLKVPPGSPEEDRCVEKLRASGWKQESLFQIAYYDRQVIAFPKGRGSEAIDGIQGGVYKVGTAVAAVVLGFHHWIYAVTSEGKSTCMKGEPVLRMINRHHAVQKQLQEQAKMAPACWKGRGYKKRHQKLLSHRKQWANYTDTLSKQIASWLVRWAVRSDVGEIILPDLSGIREDVEEEADDKGTPDRLRVMVHRWPYFKMINAIKSASERYAVKVTVHQTHGIARVCPKCGGDRLPTREQLFVCSNPECLFTREVDAVEAINLLWDAGVSGIIDKQILADLRILGGRAGEARKYWHLHPGHFRNYEEKKAALLKQKKALQKEAKKDAKEAAKLFKRSLVQKEAGSQIDDEVRRLRKEAEGEEVRNGA